MRVEPFKKLDFYHIELDARCGVFDWVEEGSQVALLFEGMERTQTYWSVWEGDKVVLVYGLVELWPGVADVSIFYSDDFSKYYWSLCKHLKYSLSCAKMFYERIQMTCLKDPRFLKFGLFFGFEVEGVLRKFGKRGEDYYMLSWVKEE